MRHPVTTPSRPAFYALEAGGWRDYVTLLHVPYTMWHLSYVAMGASIAPTMHVDRLAGTVLAFFLALGIAAHALDELKGRPLRTSIPDGILVALAAASLAGAVTLGAVATLRFTLWVLPFMGFGAFMVLAYNLELWRGRFHSDFWFALSWGAFPALTAYHINALGLGAEAVLMAAACFFLSLAQRVLSTQVRTLRRHARAAALDLGDQGWVPLDPAQMLRTPEQALKLLNLSVVALAVALLLFRLL